MSSLAHTPSCMGRGDQWHQPTDNLLHALWHQLPPYTRVQSVVSLASKGKSPSGECVVASRELWGVSTGAESHTAGLVKLADIYMKWRYVSERRNGSRREWILTNQRAGNSRCGTVMDAFRRWIILTSNKRERLYIFPSKIHQGTIITTADTSSKSGVFMIQMTCFTRLSLRADSSLEMARQAGQLTSQIDPTT